MADIKQAKKLLSELPANDSLKALDEATFWLDSVKRTDGFKVYDLFELYDLIDQAGKIHQRRLSQDYLATDRHEKFREHKLWNTVHEFWKLLASAYTQCIEQYEAGAAGAGALKKDLATIAARATHALALQLKWTLLRYGPIDEQVWEELGRVYFFAESKGVATTTTEIYPGIHGEGTVQQEFLKAMLLAVSSTDGLTPLKQEIAERTVAHFASSYTLASAPAEGCNYFYDLAADEPPARMRKGVVPSERTRFVGASRALPELKKLIEDIKSLGIVPAHINLGGTFDSDLVLSVMEHLAVYWADEPPARSSERRQTATRLTVVHGFRNVIDNVAPAVDAASLDFEMRDGSESWIVENVSDGGYGAIIPQVKGDWIKVGTLLGVQSENSQYWGTGVIRRLARDQYQQRRVGIQILSKAIIPVTVSAAGTLRMHNAVRDNDAAILLSTSPDRNGEIALLIGEGSYTAGQSLRMRVRGKNYLLKPCQLLEGGEDFDWAKFSIVPTE